jgi:CHAT domain-containing protein
MNYRQLYLTILCLTIPTILPVTASNLSKISTSTAATTTVEPSSNPLLKAAQRLNQRGTEALAVGKPDQALADWRQAHQLYAQAKDQQGMIGTKINQAQALQSLGFYRQALLNLQEVNATLQQQPDSQLKMQSLLGLGNSLRALGIREQKTTIASQGITLGAKETLTQALKIATDRQDRAAIDRINLSLGTTLNLIGGPEQEQAAIDTYQKIAPDAAPLVRIQAQINLYRIQSQPSQKTAPNTLTFLTDTRKTLDSISPSRSTIYAYINLADAIKKNQETNDPDREILIPVARLLGTAIEQARNIKDSRAEAQAVGALGSLYALTGQNQEARKLTQKALVIAENLPAPDLAYRLDRQLGKIIMASNPTERDIEVATSAYRQAINHLKSLRNDLNAVDADAQFSFRDDVEPIYREYVSLLLRDGQKISEQNLVTARDLMESLQVAELENFLRQGCLDTYTVQLDKIDRSAAVIYPIILPDRVATIASIPGQPLRYYSQKISTATVEETIAGLQKKIQTPNFDERAFKQQSKQIYDLLLAPLAGDLAAAKTKTLVFVLDGAFNNIPMSVLYDGNKYLVESYSLALTPGLQLVPPQESTDRSRSQALLGGISEGRQGFSPLPNAKTEIDLISQILPNQKLFNEQFTSKPVSTNLVASNAPFVHFATHGQFSSKAEDTYILTWDNKLNLDQFSNLLKDRGIRSGNAIELLVLSACQTATGDKRATLGLAGVAIRARAKSTIASLWSVSDEATQDLMVNLYKNLATKNLSKGESLRQAQQTLLQNPKYRSPYFWAPFVLVGNWQ